jgi:N-acetyl-anhydromuramyl-L-alanine amidase AmpD
MAAWFANPAAGVSAHYGISEDGEVVQYVDEGNTAHHAGNWDINQRSIGIEHAGIGEHYVPTEPQLVASARLAVDVCVRYGITPNGLTIRPHRDFRATRCPANFPMDMYVGILQGLMLCGDTRA